MELIEENAPPVSICPPQDSRGLMALNIPLHSKTWWLLCVHRVYPSTTLRPAQKVNLRVLCGFQKSDFLPIQH